MKLQEFELPTFCNLSNDDLRRRIQSLRGMLLASRRPAEYRTLTKRGWAKRKAEMRYSLGMFCEILRLREEKDNREFQDELIRLDKMDAAALPSCFDSDLLTAAELEILRGKAVWRTGQDSLRVMTTICDLRRRLAVAA